MKPTLHYLTRNHPGPLTRLVWTVSLLLMAGSLVKAQLPKQWDKTLGGSGSETASLVLATSDGGYLLAGYSNSPNDGDKTAPNVGDYDAWLVKVDGNGNKQWDHTYGGSGYDRLSSVLATADGGFLLGGGSSSTAEGDWDYWLVKVDATGTKQWEHTFGGTGTDEITSMVVTTDGSYLLAGVSESSTGRDKTAPNMGFVDYWIVKVDVNGNKQWDKAFGSSIWDALSSVVATADGGYLLAGHSNSPIGGDKTEAKGNYDYWIVKVDAMGNKQWDKAFGSSSREGLASAIATSDGGYLLAGHSDSPAGGDKTAPNIRNYDYWLVKLGCVSPVVEITPSIGQLSCTTPTVTLTATSIPGASYAFSTGAAQINGGNTAIVAQAGTYSVVVTSFNGCSTTASVTVSGSCSPPASRISVLHLDNDNKQLTNNSIRPYLQLANEGTTPISYQDITVRYWLTVEEFSPLNTNLVIDWAQLGTGKIKMKYVELPQPRQGALGYIEYSFDNSTGSLAGGANSGPIQSRISKNDWTPLNEADDYSYAGTTNYTKNNRITAYLAGQLVWGTEPTLVEPVQSLKVYAENKSSATTNSISTYVQLRNEGNVPVSYPKLAVRYWLTAEGTSPLNVYLDYAQLGNSNLKGKLVRLTTPVPGADSYLELSFVPALGNLYPLSGTGNIQYRITKSDWSNFNQSNDHSYQPSGPMAPNPKMTVYLDGALVYGTEPSAPSARLASAEESCELKVVVLGNPIPGNEVELEVGGAAGQPIRLLLTDLQGHILAEKQVIGREAIERHQLSVAGQSAGILLLRVSTPTQWQTVKLLKAN